MKQQSNICPDESLLSAGQNINLISKSTIVEHKILLLLSCWFIVQCVFMLLSQKYMFFDKTKAIHHI